MNDNHTSLDEILWIVSRVLSLWKAEEKCSSLKTKEMCSSLKKKNKLVPNIIHPNCLISKSRWHSPSPTRICIYFCLPPFGCVTKGDLGVDMGMGVGFPLPADWMNCSSLFLKYFLTQNTGSMSIHTFLLSIRLQTMKYLHYFLPIIAKPPLLVCPTWATSSSQAFCVLPSHFLTLNSQWFLNVCPVG